ncbi:uncharacterized protein C11orf24 homolog [Tamandua tetradactyla]|uniref:uncharacterized protein C11orf24 homolog n=1 Tax=Tamandua tetradactyla TaxID=48850 RepID=UPI0040543AC2
MWTVLVLIWISSLSLSENQETSSLDSFHNLTGISLVQKNASVEISGTVGTRTSGNITSVTPSPVTLTKATSMVNSNYTEVTAETTSRTGVGALTVAGGTADHVASGTPMLATSSVSTLAARAVSPTSPGLSSLSTPRVQVPSSSMLPRTAVLVSLAPSTVTTAAATPNAGSPGNMHNSSEHLASSPPADPALTTSPQVLNVSAQASATQVSTGRPKVTTVSRATPTLSPTTQEPTTLPSVTSVATTAGTTSNAQAGELNTSTVPAHHASPTPTRAATSPTTHTQPNPALPTQATEGPGIPQTPEQLGTEATPGAASTRLTPGSSGGPTMQATTSCQPSTQGHHLVATSELLPQFWVNRSVLLVVLLLGVTLFITVLVLFALQAYESYKRKDYTQVDYLINGMYADSEM